MPLLTTRDILRLLLVESLPSQGGVIISVTVPEAKEGEAAPPLPGRALSAPDADLGKASGKAPGEAPGEALGKAPAEAREKAPAVHPTDFFPSAAASESGGADPAAPPSAALPPPRREEKRFFPLALDPDAPLEWAYQPLDPALAAQNAMARYAYKGLGCGSGVFYGVMESLSQKYGKPYADFPLELLELKKGRYSGAGKICGALIGASALISIFLSDNEPLREKLLRELMDWYQDTELPLHSPGAEPVPASRAGSVYCADSLISWGKVAPGADAKMRKLRCGSLTADVAAKAVELLNGALVRG